MTSEELLSKTIDYLRFPMIVGVVFVHFNLVENGLYFHGVKYMIDSPGWCVNVVNLCSEVLGQMAVPVFFVISGFLFFYHIDFGRATYVAKLRKRVMTLFVPYLLWNLLVVIKTILYQLPFLFPNATPAEIHLTPLRIFLTLFANYANEGIFVYPSTEGMISGGGFPYPINLPMWYLRDLMVMVLSAPLIYWMITKLGKVFVIILGLFFYLVQPVFMPMGGWLVMLCQAAFFFSWGAYFSITRQNFVDSFRNFRYAPLLYILVAVVDMLTKKTDYNLFIHEVGLILGVVSAVVMVSWLLEKGMVKVNRTLANSCLFVFGLHLMIIDEIGRVILSVVPLQTSSYGMLLLYFLTPSLAIVISVLLYVFLKHYMPVACRLLTGGR